MTSYGPFLVAVPAFSDADLVYSIDESKQILKFFYPARAAAIDTVTLDDTARAYAQTLMIAAMDGSYWISYITGLFNSMVGLLQSGKNPSLLALAKKLSQSFVKTWWHNVKEQRHIDAPEIYNSIRIDIANALNQRVDAYLRNPNAAANDLPQGFRAYLLETSIEY